MKRKLLIYCGIIGLAFAAASSAQLRDPTRPVNYDNSTTGNAWKLTAVIVSPERKVAVINDQAVTLGEDIYDQKVVAIESNYVILEGNEGRMTLYLLEKQIKH